MQAQKNNTVNKFLLGFLLLFNVICYCQNRTNNTLPLISKENKGILLQAKGWLKNQYGDWVHNDNKIPNDLGIQFKSIDNFEVNSLGQDNFISFQLKDIVIKDSTFVLLLKKVKSGHYVYPAIQEEWRKNYNCDWYIIDKSELIKFSNLDSDELKTIEVNYIYYGGISVDNLAEITNLYLSKDINKTIIEKEIDGYNLDKRGHINVDITYFKSKSIIQFYFYNEYMNHKDRYYETNLVNFNKFIKIN